MSSYPSAVVILIVFCGPSHLICVPLVAAFIILFKARCPDAPMSNISLARPPRPNPAQGAVRQPSARPDSLTTPARPNSLTTATTPCRPHATCPTPCVAANTRLPKHLPRHPGSPRHPLRNLPTSAPFLLHHAPILLVTTPTMDKLPPVTRPPRRPPRLSPYCALGIPQW